MEKYLIWIINAFWICGVLYFGFIGVRALRTLPSKANSKLEWKKNWCTVASYDLNGDLKQFSNGISKIKLYTDSLIFTGYLFSAGILIEGGLILNIPIEDIVNIDVTNVKGTIENMPGLLIKYKNGNKIQSIFIRSQRKGFDEFESKLRELVKNCA